MQHQIGRGSAARRGDDLGAGDKDIADELDVWKLFFKQVMVAQCTAVSIPFRNPALAKTYAPEQIAPRGVPVARSRLRQFSTCGVVWL